MRKILDTTFGIIAALVLIWLGLRLIDGDVTAPSYSFLAGRNPVSSKKVKKGTEDSRGIEDRRYIYSFEADFNDLCTKADAELRPDGFAGKTLVGEAFFRNESRIYYRKESFPRGPVWIYIYKNIYYEKFPNSEHSAFCEKEGWVMVEVFYFRGWRWPF